MKRRLGLLPTIFVALVAASCSFGGDQPSVVEPTSVVFDQESYTINLNESLKLEPTVLPKNASNKELVWSLSSGSTYISLAADGTVTGKKEGNATVKARVKTNTQIFATCTISVVKQTVPVTGISLSSSYTVTLNKTLSITPTISPSYASNKNVTWTIEDTSIASYSNGSFKGLKEGTTTITAKTSDGGFTASASLEVKRVAVTGVSVSPTKLELKEGKTSTISATVAPSNASVTTVTWSSGNKNVATVSSEGLVTAVKAGTTTITATTTDGGFTASTTVTVTEKSAADAWTILIYMDGSTLEAPYANTYTQGIPYSKCGLATCDIREIIDTPNKPDDVNIVFETGGASEWTTNANGKYSNGYDISTEYLQRHHVENGKLVLDKGQDKITKQKMGLQSVLQSFIEYGLDNYPADKTALILWNHGGGMQGVCFDDDGSGQYCVSDGLEGKEVAAAVSGALSKCGMTGQKLEFIGYDACIMELQDLAEMNSPYFNYMLGSQELENGTGWDYDSWLDDLYAGKSTEVVLKAACDGFIADNGGASSYSNDQTLSYLNLSYASEYKEAWEDFALALKNDGTVANNRTTFNDVIKNSKRFSDYSSEGVDYRDNGLFDAKDFINNFSNDSTLNPNKKYKTYLDDILTAHGKLVGYSTCGKGAGNAYGLNMFWTIASKTKSYNPYTAGTDTHFENWAYLASNYYGQSGGGYYGY